MVEPASRIEALRRAIAIIESQSATACLLGLIQASVWGWLKWETPLPPEHVLAVETATGISRHELRPDIYPLDAPAPPPVQDIDLEPAR